MKKLKKQPFLSVIIAAGGSSSRMKGENKLLLKINNKPVLCMTVEAFENCEEVNEIIISAKKEELEAYSRLITEYGYKKVTKIVAGGNTRLESVYNALLSCSHKTDFVMVHDAARPLIEKKDIISVYDKIKKYGSAVAGRMMTDTVKKIENNRIIKTIDRKETACVQTPQGADADLLRAAIKKALDSKDPSITDESSALEKLGVKPYLAECSAANIKITYKEDISLAKAIYEMRNSICE